MNIDKILDEIFEYLDKLDPEIQDEIAGIIYDYLDRIIKLVKAPAWLRGLVGPITANSFIHLIVAVAKRRGIDNRDGRTKILNWTRLMFQLPDWTPKWLYVPFD